MIGLSTVASVIVFVEVIVAVSEIFAVTEGVSGEATSVYALLCLWLGVTAVTKWCSTVVRFSYSCSKL